VITLMFRKLASSLTALLLLCTSAFADPIVTGSKPFTFIPGTVISSSQVNADFDYIINQVNTNAAKNGVNSSITALLGLTTPLDPGVGGSPIYTSGVAGGTANDITVSTTQPAISSYSLVAGNFVLFVAASTNTGPSTLDVNTTGITAIQKTTASGLVALTGGEIVSGQSVLTYFDGTRYILLNQYQLFGAQTNVASAATTDLALAGSHNVNVTGTTTITSFGSNASTSLPLYYVKFAGALTITYDGTALITPSGTNILTAANDQAWIEYLGSGNWRIRQYLKADITPSVQRFTTGTTLTYTPNPGVRYIRVRMIGGGGGGGADTTNNGSAGGTTSFGSWTAVGGSGGLTAGTGGAGGTGGATGTGTLIARFDGGNGGTGGTTGSGNNSAIGTGGNGYFGGGGQGGLFVQAVPKANTGGGGSGAGSGSTAGGGGAGEYVEFFVPNPAPTTYSVGALGAGGAAGGVAGADGAAGVIIVEENYN
jgi:hypothetical protein